MIDPGNLATSIVATLMPWLTKAAGKGLEKLGESTAKTLFATLTKKLGHSSAGEALEKLAKTPTDEYSKALLTVHLGEALKANTHLAQELQRLLEEKPQQAGHTVIATDGGVVADHSSTVIQVQGSGNTITRS